MTFRFLLVAALSTFVTAYSGTFPIIAWSSQHSNSLHSLPVTFSNTDSPLTQFLHSEEVCSHDAVIIIEHPGVHASDLRSLSPSSFTRRASSDPSSRSFPYVPMTSHIDVMLDADMISRRCNSRLVSFGPSESSTFDLEYKHVIHLSMPPLGMSDQPRKSVMSQHIAMLSTELDNIVSVFPKHMVVYSGSPLLPDILKRQSPPAAELERPVLDVFDGSAFQSPNTTLPIGGILKRYQLLTPGLISVLLVVLFVLLPIVMFGISALASIQSPLRVEAPKGYSAREKKVQ
ncbi:hypothetical protein AX17_006026 [Amanita inopinata Kibby_2008]|nr:hypothetical protein AX17_006026 [Amanita inopinata Kibby_2008]